MGCGASAVGVEPNTIDFMSKVKSPEHAKKNENLHNSIINDEKEIARSKLKVDTNANFENANNSINNMKVPKSVAFEVAFNDHSLLKNPPRRLQTLAPLNVQHLTPELLEEKQKVADKKRQKELQRRVSTSKRTSKRRKELLKAKEFEKLQVAEQATQLEMQLKTAEIRRGVKLEEIRSKNRLREQRAVRAREKAKRLNQDDPEYELDVEKDTHFNADSDECWSDEAEQIFPPKKKTSRKLQPTHSASTVDSYDNAFMREPNTGNDAFFDS